MVLQTTNNNSTAIGSSAKAKEANATAVGMNATALGNQSTAIGSNANVADGARESVAIGNNASTAKVIVLQRVQMQNSRAIKRCNWF